MLTSFNEQKGGIAKRSFAYDSLRKLEIEGTTTSDEEEIIKNCAAMIYIGPSLLPSVIFRLCSFYNI